MKQILGTAIKVLRNKIKLMKELSLLVICQI